ncbi:MULTISPECIES: hypothetical protein [unclassified Brenneria]|uniref:hypothetical protein n=1 Tax=unclassified Brenneria TaxID=2634434 RepID=UPI0029C29788|nr:MULTISPECIES: hypothetical protein [unclassified Brenneria]MDX5627312.1 hypothetical protein [Brenneria sp. L3-3Z]MDX5694532.1 hypothetical protein [Brenneria sp. L4-2C]
MTVIFNKNIVTRRIINFMTNINTDNAVYRRIDVLDTFTAEFMTELAAVDDLFQHPKTKGLRTLQGIFDVIWPWATVNSIEGRLDDNCNPDGVEFIRMTAPTGADIYVYQTPEEVWFDVSRLLEGEFGSAIYQAVADYAVNTRRIFIGDPAGLSDIAIRRRTEAMLSSALKHGSTEYLEPHARQRCGECALGIPPLKWRSGNDIYNISSMIETSLTSIKSQLPEIENARYDFAIRAFRTGEGQPLTNGMLRAWSTRPRIRAAGAGGATLKRAIFLNTLLRMESSERSGLLEQVLRQRNQFVSSALEGLFY